MARCYWVQFDVWEYLEQSVKQSNGTVKPRADLEIYALGMIGGGHAFASTISTDYPWNCLGTGTLVDVGGGVGGTSLDLAKQFPHLHFVVEDREPTIEQAKVVWSQEYPEAIGNGRVRLLTHDFFTEQPIRGARVYFLRHILYVLHCGADRPHSSTATGTTGQTTNAWQSCPSYGRLCAQSLLS